ncbi:MAG: hypothetical protein LPK45_04340, partial [Bacteroidota bacterium]|nr:hypothetical protein [Bacteroidota bacterium]MDX5430283.1 hypothetical protein [Bacteroidota bacterium]MDX5469044.1 hypothetical protein [Bacteroidota bacterium]
CLDLVEGQFVPESRAGLHFMDAQRSALAYQLLILPITETQHLEANRALKQGLLEDILRYFRLHFDSFHDLQSHEILREVLSV